MTTSLDQKVLMDSKPIFTSLCYVHCNAEGDTIAFEKALSLAVEMHASLDIIAVLDEVPHQLLERLASLGADASLLVDESERAEKLEALASTARSRGVTTSTRVMRGAFFVKIMERVSECRHDLVIKGTEHANFIHQVFFGHLDRQLIRKCPCPVWIENPAVWSRRGRIVAAVDTAPYQEDQESSPDLESLNVEILETAVSIAKAFGAELHVVHVWSFDLETKLRGHIELSETMIAEYGESIRRDHLQAFTALISPYMHEITGMQLLKGHAGEQIARLATEEAMDVIVMGTACRTGIAGILIGNTAETVLDQVACSVVALKPRGYRVDLLH